MSIPTSTVSRYNLLEVFLHGPVETFNYAIRIKSNMLRLKPLDKIVHKKKYLCDIKLVFQTELQHYTASSPLNYELLHLYSRHMWYIFGTNPQCLLRYLPSRSICVTFPKFCRPPSATLTFRRRFPLRPLSHKILVKPAAS